MKMFVKLVLLFVFLPALAISSYAQGNTGRQYSAAAPIVVSGQVISCPTCGTGAGGGIIGYSASSLTLTANTRFFPVVGGGTPSTTETDVDSPAPSAATIANFFASFSTALGAGNTAVFTIRKNAADTSITCTVTGASQTECQDNTHSISVAANDLLTVKVVTTGTLVVTPTLVMTAQFGTTGSNGTVNNCSTAHSTAIYSATGTAVSCSGATGSTGQVWTSNGASSDPTWQPASGGSSGVTTNNQAPGSDTLSANGSFATTQAIAGNAAVAGDVWDVWADGIESVNSGGSHQFTIKLGSTSITAATGFSINPGSNFTWSLHARITFQAIGASGKVLCEFYVNQQNAQGGAIALAQSGAFNIYDTAGNTSSRIASLTNAPITVDSTASIPITLAMTGFAASDTAQLNHVTYQKYH